MFNKRANGVSYFGHIVRDNGGVEREQEELYHGRIIELLFGGLYC